MIFNSDEEEPPLGLAIAGRSTIDSKESANRSSSTVNEGTTVLVRPDKVFDQVNLSRHIAINSASDTNTLMPAALKISLDSDNKSNSKSLPGIIKSTASSIHFSSKCST